MGVAWESELTTGLAKLLMAVTMATVGHCPAEAGIVVAAFSTRGSVLAVSTGVTVNVFYRDTRTENREVGVLGLVGFLLYPCVLSVCVCVCVELAGYLLYPCVLCVCVCVWWVW